MKTKKCDPYCLQFAHSVQIYDTLSHEEHMYACMCCAMALTTYRDSILLLKVAPAPCNRHDKERRLVYN